MSSLKYEALIKRYEADVAEAKAILEVYFSNAVGVGEHPQIIDEMNKQVGNLADAQGRLATLIDLVSINEPIQEGGEE
jgi:hypothetical protein